MVRGLPTIVEHDRNCEACIVGKQYRKPFQLGHYRRARVPLEFVHSDNLCGPMKTPTLGGNFYFMTLIYDYSRKIWVYFLKNKSYAFEKFKEFKALSKKQSSHYIKVLRTKRGGEYISKEFMNFCKSQGIQRQLTT